MKEVFFLVSGGGFQWESLTLVSQLKENWSITYIVPQSSVYEGSALLQAIDGADYIALPDVSSRANSRLDQTLKNIWKIYHQVSPLIRDKQPAAIVCLGSSLSFPIAISARRLGVKMIFIESMTRTTDLSITGELLSRLGLADQIYVQWPEQEGLGKRVRYRGTVL